jgi:hypothetical protein
VADYCTPADLYTFGVPRGSIPNPGRHAASASTSTDAITLDEHGFDLGDLVSFRAESGGSLPSPLAAGTTYYALPVSDSIFQVSEEPEGDAIELTSVGSIFLVLAPLPKAAAIAWASRAIDDMLPAHLVPLTEPISPIVSMTCAELAAAKLGYYSGAVSRSLGAMSDEARKRVERWAKGVPIRGEDKPALANKAVSASLPYNDGRGWNRNGGIA